MDPFIEGQAWEDFHARLINAIAGALAPGLRPKLEVRLRETGEVVTIIEVLSPANKRPGGEGWVQYRAKRDAVLRSAAHLVELDLLRGGERIPALRPLPPGDYYAVVSRAGRRPVAEVWPASLRDPLPTIAIPLAGDDPALPLDLQAVFAAV